MPLFNRSSRPENPNALARPQETRVTVSRNGIEIRREGRPLNNPGRPGQGLVFLLLDCSYSMEGRKLAQARQGALNFSVEARLKGYAVGLIRFSSEAALVCEPSNDAESLRPRLEALTADGSTNLAAGLRLAADKLGPGPGQRAIVVVTDGQPDSREATFREALAAKRAGIDIITIGTDDADQAMLRELATRSDLAIMVANNQLGAGIAASARMLPG